MAGSNRVNIFTWVMFLNAHDPTKWIFSLAPIYKGGHAILEQESDLRSSSLWVQGAGFVPCQSGPNPQLMDSWAIHDFPRKSFLCVWYLCMSCYLMGQNAELTPHLYFCLSLQNTALPLGWKCKALVLSVLLCVVVMLLAHKFHLGVWIKYYKGN